MRGIFLFFICGMSQMVSAADSHSVTSIELLVGAAVSHSELEIFERQSSIKVAEFYNEQLTITPSFSLRTEPQYIWQGRNWAYTVSADFFTSKFEKQVTDTVQNYNPVLSNRGTKIEGVSLYITPIIYYQFGRENADDWQYRVGIGAGVGYQNHEGEYVVTHAEHPEFGQVKTIEHSKLGLSAGLYAEARYKKHHIIFNGDLITNELSGDSYRYLENHVSITYHYQLHTFTLPF